MVDIHILSASGGLGAYLSVLEKMLERCVRATGKKLDLPNIDVIVADRPGSVIPEIGLVGFTYSSNLIVIYLDSTFANFPNNLWPELLNAFAHESHHATRMRKLGYGSTLMDAVISEGLADHFGKEVCGDRVKLWNESFYKKVPDVSEKIKPLLGSTDFNFDDWFFGSENESIPRCAGYAYGYRLVAAYLADHLGVTASKLVYTPSGEFSPYISLASGAFENEGS